MPRYFIDIDDGERHLRDDEGSEYPGLQEAHDAAMHTLPEVARDVVLDGGRQALVATVRDAGDHALLKVTLSLRTEWLAVGTDQAIGLQGVPFAARPGSIEPSL